MSPVTAVMAAAGIGFLAGVFHALSRFGVRG